MAVRSFKFGGRFEFEFDLVGCPLSRCHVTGFFEVELDLGDFRQVDCFNRPGRARGAEGEQGRPLHQGKKESIPDEGRAADSS